LSALYGQPRSASVMSLNNCLIAALTQERFLHLLRENADISFRLLRALAGIIRNSTDRIMDLSTLAANNRVQADLLRQARSGLIGENQAEIRPIPVHGDIASRVSTTRETVARVLSDLARQNIIERKKNTLLIKDLAQLREMVEEVRGE
jgi:CRP/FNR family transcriptional regulator, cyclic AMP receptor protein